MERSGTSKTAVSGKVATYGIEYKCYYTDYSRTYVAAGAVRGEGIARR